MQDEPAPLVAEHQFFTSLAKSDLESLDHVLVDDFILIDVLGGSEINKTALLAMMGSGQLTFNAIVLADYHLRFYHATAVVNGRAQMTGSFGPNRFAANSRYTHVYVEQQGRWRLVSAQGTPIPKG